MFWTPGLSLRSNPGLKLANAFGVFIQFKAARRTLSGFNDYLMF